jgi:hypothetical protein
VQLTASQFNGALNGNAATATTATNQSGGTVSATTGTFSSTLQTAQINSRAQVRATGWYGTNSGTYTGLGVEMGISGGQGYLLCYNRDTAAYNVLNFNATSFVFNNAVSVTGAVTATNYIGAGTGLTGTASSLSIGGNATTATTATNWAGIPAGTAMIFKQTSAPTGWTKVTTDNDAALRVVSGTAGTGGTAGFTSVFASRTPAGSISSTTATNQNTTAGGSLSSTTVTGSASATTLAESQMPSHKHPVKNVSGSGNTLGYSSPDCPRHGNAGYWNYNGPDVPSFPTGGSGSHNHGLSTDAHSHTFTGTAHSHTQDAHSHTFTGTAMDFAVKYVDVIVATKN